MFHSPILPERYKAASRPAAARAPAGLRPSSFGPDDPIRTAIAAFRAETLARTALWLGLLGLFCMAVVVGTATGSRLLSGWAALVGGVAAVTIVRPGRGGRTGRSVPAGMQGLAGIAVHALLWAALPLLTAPDDARMAAAALAAMMTGAVLFAAVPAATLGWVMLLGGALCGLLVQLDPALPPGLLLLVPIQAAVLLGGCRIVERLLIGQLTAAAHDRAAHESIGLLLKEYEDQGIGWLWQTDAADRLVYVSPRICVLLGRSTSQLVGHSLPAILGDDARLAAAIAARRSFGDLDVAVATPGGPRCVALAGSPVAGPGGGHAGFRGVGTDITEARRSRDRLTQLAGTDMLTGLPNRQHLRRIFATAIDDSVRTGRACAILFLDLDGFKPVNDMFGHSMGDAVLRIVAQRLAAEVGALGLLGRVGGDEFALLLHDGSHRPAVEAIVRRLIAAIAEPFLCDKGEIRIGISVGCAFAPDDGLSIDDLLLKADIALYEAKRRGRGTFCLFDAAMQRAADARLRLERDLRLALDRGQLCLAYQPIVAAADLAVVGFEALLRWQHPEHGAIAPADFIPMAEETGLIVRIGAWVIEQACRDAACWPDQLFVSVNLSARQLLDPGLPQVVATALATARLQPNRLELEVTESVFPGDGDRDGALDVLRRLRTLGTGIALDDFGTGQSSFGYLATSIFDALKIDGGFVRDAATRSETGAIIGAIVGLANGFRLQITAEGIETPDDLDRMRRFGCHRLQGYLFGHPMDHARTLAHVGDRSPMRGPRLPV